MFIQHKPSGQRPWPYDTHVYLKLMVDKSSHYEDGILLVGDIVQN